MCTRIFVFLFALFFFRQHPFAPLLHHTSLPFVSFAAFFPQVFTQLFLTTSASLLRILSLSLRLSPLFHIARFGGKGEWCDRTQHGVCMHLSARRTALTTSYKNSQSSDENMLISSLSSPSLRQFCFAAIRGYSLLFLLSSSLHFFPTSLISCHESNERNEREIRERAAARPLSYM